MKKKKISLLVGAWRAPYGVSDSRVQRGSLVQPVTGGADHREFTGTTLHSYYE